VPLAWFAELNFARTSDFKSFGYTFVRLIHIKLKKALHHKQLDEFNQAQSRN